jgi:hypothetical protein
MTVDCITRPMSEIRSNFSLASLPGASSASEPTAPALGRPMLAVQLHGRLCRQSVLRPRELADLHRRAAQAGEPRRRALGANSSAPRQSGACPRASRFRPPDAAPAASSPAARPIRAKRPRRDCGIGAAGGLRGIEASGGTRPPILRKEAGASPAPPSGQAKPPLASFRCHPACRLVTGFAARRVNGWPDLDPGAAPSARNAGDDDHSTACLMLLRLGGIGTR